MAIAVPLPRERYATHVPRASGAGYAPTHAWREGGMRQRKVIYAVLIGLAVAAAACASNLRVRTDYDPSANFKKYRTFSIREGNSTGNPVMDQRIKEQIVTALRAKGLDEVRAENADLIVTAHTATRTARSYETFYDTWPGWRWRWGEPTVVVNEFPVGTLVVDMFDNQAKTAIWHGYASEVLSDKPSENAQKVDQAVQKLIDKYPA